MRLLQTLCLIACLLCIAAALTGIGGISAGSSNTAVARLDATGRIVTMVSAFFFAAFSYGIYRKLPMTWPAGFVLLALGYVWFVYAAVHATSGMASVRDAPSWLVTTVTILAGGAVGIFWAFRWKRQRSYFR